MHSLIIGTKVFHNCDLDILEFRVEGVRTYVDHYHYELRATHNVGAQGRVRILVADVGDRLRYVDCIEPEDDANERGLVDFLEGEYFVDRHQAVMDFYATQESLSSASLDKHKRAYDNQLALHTQLLRTIAVAKAEAVSAAESNTRN